ncbi:MAG: endonuclease/exonuclease/phosphatase family protein [Gemmatimonadetes bacterium]|nr:endonuclease/exonuclease/phosphatase family protein [Gemmatimonadota bacterium]
MLQWVVVALGSLMVAGTLASLSSSPHWLVRLWDFPRVQIALVTVLSALAYWALFFRGRPGDWVFLAATAACTIWQAINIFPYTPLAPVQVQRQREAVKGRCLRVLISNVLMENDGYDRLLEMIDESDPDLVLAVETDHKWARALEPLAERYPQVVRQPQDNYYGLMLFSRFPLMEPRVEFLVQDDIPSVHTAVQLPSGDWVALHGLHPRPPEPLSDQDSTPRDAELVLMGRAIGDAEARPTLVVGDLNDVAWSPTTRLFLRLSGMLDPRVGRGLFSSFNAKNPLFRYPLDHVFHSDHFRLVKLQRLPSIGSDHFPMLVELSYEPTASAEQDGLDQRPEDREEAQEKLEIQAEAARTGDDRPGRE